MYCSVHGHLNTVFNTGARCMGWQLASLQDSLGSETLGVRWLAEAGLPTGRE